MIGIDLFWDVLHTQVRGLIIDYASRKKRNANMRKTTLNREIELLKLDINSDDDNTSLLWFIQEKIIN